MLVRHRLACAALVLVPMLQPPPPMPLQGGVQGAPPISVRTAVVDGLMVQYLTAGHGPTILLLHGTLKTPECGDPSSPG